MPLTINVGLSRKAAKDYQSTGLSINITAELDQGLLARPAELQQQIDGLYHQAEEALDRRSGPAAEEHSASAGGCRGEGEGCACSAAPCGGSADDAVGGPGAGPQRGDNGGEGAGGDACAENAGPGAPGGWGSRGNGNGGRTLPRTAARAARARAAATVSCAARRAEASGQSGGSNGHSATLSQLRAIRAIAARMDLDPDAEAGELLGADLEHLSIVQASRLIDHLKALLAGSTVPPQS